MSANSFGEIFRVTTFGESHGPGIGAVIEGCPAGLKLDLSQVQAELDRDPDRQGVAVVVRLNKIAELSGNVLQTRD